LGQKIAKNPVLFFFQSLCQKGFVEFLTFDCWNCLGETKNDVYRGDMPISQMGYRAQKKSRAASQ